MNTTVLISLCLLFAVCSSEPPKYRSARLEASLAKQQKTPAIDVIPLIPTEKDIPEEKSGPYPPSGWKPAGEQLELPTEVTEPDNEYGSPAEKTMDERSGPFLPLGWKPAVRQLEPPSDKVPDMTTPSNEYGSPAEAYGAPNENSMAEKSGPYPPSGWKPAGRQLELPGEEVPEVTTLSNEYGSPEVVYGAPAENSEAKNSGPYPPSGWKPTGRQLELPSEMTPEETTPADEYGSPVEVYGAPAENNMAKNSGPYPPSGWKPTGLQFELPSEMTPEEIAPAEEYGSPVEVYGPPAQTYGSPTSTASVDSTKVSEGTDTSNAQGNLNYPQNYQPTYQQGAYYILLPDSSLQKYVYNFVSDPARMQYSSRIQSVGTQSLSSPLLAYNPQYFQMYQNQW